MKIQEKISELIRRLAPVLGEGEARASLRVAAEDIFGWTHTDLLIKADDEISDFRAGQLDRVVDRLLLGEPLQYILGKAYFYGMNFEVTPDVLIPRPETAELVDIIVRENQTPDLRVMDVGTGSGCIAIALSRNLPFSRVTAVDVSSSALEIARKNAAKFKARISFVHADIMKYEVPSGSFDVIVSNPPYIAESERVDMEARVLAHEPSMALFVPDDDPLRFYKRIAQIASDALAEGGKLYFEINPLFANDMQSMLNAGGWADVRIEHDIHGRKRFAMAVKSRNNED